MRGNIVLALCLWSFIFFAAKSSGETTLLEESGVSVNAMTTTNCSQSMQSLDPQTARRAVGGWIDGIFSQAFIPSIVRRQPARSVVDFALRLPAVRRLYIAANQLNNGAPLGDRVLETLKVGVECNFGDLRHIPKKGPLVFVANHPHGMIDGLALLKVLRGVRPDVKIMATTMLDGLPGISDEFFIVDNLTERDETDAQQLARRGQINRSALRQIRNHLSDGNALIIYPGGVVSRFQEDSGRIEDGPWNPMVANLIQRVGAAAVPIFIGGTNSWLFHRLGRFGETPQTFLLGNELVNKRGQTMQLHIGPVIPPILSQALPKGEFARGLRSSVYRLEAQLENQRPEAEATASQMPIAERTPIEAIEAEIAKLRSDPQNILRESRNTSVFIARGREIPSILREIGRLREITFRKVGEGSGKDLDLDPFDPDYLHMFVWDHDSKEIAGAYRLRGMDEAPINSYYLATLFRFNSELEAQLKLGLEMGRAFVQPDFQKRGLTLGLLWKGIATYVSRNPRYRRLVGAVSMSDAFSPYTQSLLLQFFRRHQMLHNRDDYVDPTVPVDESEIDSSFIAPFGDLSLQELSEVIESIEPDATNPPELFANYMKLGGRVLGFNLDPSFGNSVDVLFLIDLLETDRHVLGMYMGRDLLESYLAAQDSE